MGKSASEPRPNPVDLSSPRLLLLGASGQVGNAWQQWLSDRVSLSCPVQAPTREELDLRDLAAVRDCILRTAPDLIVNAAAYTAVDQAECEPEEAHALNAALPAVLARSAHDVGAVLLHYSTDHVFAGMGDQAHREDDPLQPLSIYGRTKAMGESGIREHLARHLILRTSWVMGPHGHNFLKTVLKLATEQAHLRVVDDQVGTPTPARLLAAMGWLAWQHCVHAEATSPPSTPWGLYHLTPRGSTTKWAYARFIVNEARAQGWRLRTGPEQVMPITSADHSSPAPRPHNARLDVSRFERTFQVTLPSWEEGVRTTLVELKD